MMQRRTSSLSISSHGTFLTAKSEKLEQTGACMDAHDHYGNLNTLPLHTSAVQVKAARRAVGMLKLPLPDCFHCYYMYIGLSNGKRNLKFLFFALRL